MKQSIFILVLLVIALLIATKIQSFVRNNMPEPVPVEEQVACTMDAMMCPDGSWVGRTGPLCEFVCPEASTSTPMTATSTDGMSTTTATSTLDVNASTTVEAVFPI